MVESNISVPIVHIKGQVYLIGTQKVIIQFRNDLLMVRVGGGYSSFDDYLANNERIFKRTLLNYMIRSQESLEWVCEALMNDKKIP
jgi:hypothetical protein